MVCHTADRGAPFSGGKALKTPFGTIYATNITPDVETGIGSWSVEAFTRAMRRGISRKGHQLYPAFPYVHYTRMSQEDVQAAYAFLMTRQAVRQEATPNELMFPLNFRPMVAFWNLLFLRPGELKPDPAMSAEWNLGRALVEGPGHCAACHTPMGPLGNERSGHAYAGNVIDGWEAPPLNRLSEAPARWTTEQLVEYLRTGRSGAHGAAAGPMRPVTRELATLGDSDVRAMATYILSLQRTSEDISTDAPPVALPSDALRRGAKLFAGACAQCHAAMSPMQAVGGRASLSQSSAINGTSPRNLVRMIVHGIPWDGQAKEPYMPSFAGALDAQQIADLAVYVRATYATRPPTQTWADEQATRRLAEEALKDANE